MLPICVAAALDRAVARLAAVGIGEPRIDAKYLLAEVLQREPLGLSLCAQEPLTPDQWTAFEQLIDRRVDREPVAKILRRRAFYGLNFIVSRETLDPRADSESLIDLALTLPPAKTVLDLGTGTGCLLLTYLQQQPAAHGLGTDLSRHAVEVAQENAAALTLEDRASFAHGSWSDPVADGTTFDLILTNPPYIRTDEYDDLQPEVQHWDPPLALFAGPDGLAAYGQIFACLPRVSHRQSQLCLEIGLGQGANVRALAGAAGWQFLKSHRDLGGIERALAFCRNVG